MIANLTALALLVAGAAPVQDYHIFEIDAPAKADAYRVRASLEVDRIWAIEQLQFAAMFDVDGRALSCESLRSLTLGDMHKQYAIEGHWQDDDESARQPPQANFASVSTWKFDVPKLAEYEYPSALRFEWQSTVRNPGEVQVIEVTSSSNAMSPPPRMHLMDGQMDSSHGHVYLYLANPSSQPRQLTGELRFSASSTQVHIDHVTLETSTKKPWARERIGGPGWIIFAGDGRPPYRLQIARGGSACSVLSSEYRTATTQGPDWPSEAKVTRELIGAARLGDAPDAWEKHVEEMRATQARHAWIFWGILMSAAFLFAAIIAWNKG